MKMKGLLRTGLGVVGAAAGVLLSLYVLGYMFRPDLSRAVALPPPEAIAQAKRALAVDFDPANPPRFHVPVDYAAGPEAGWFPKGESPLLAELVAEGLLPPVAQRVGPEPVVYRGVEGIGRYGGTWVAAEGGFENISHRYAAATLVRWSPGGEPIVPHIARGWDISDDFREYTIHLRRGIRWSDGHPFTADDILYWWEHEANDPMVEPIVPAIMTIQGQTGRVEKVDDFTVKFIFPKPHGLFLQLLGWSHNSRLCGSPRHYLQKYHPRIGDPEVIAHAMAATQRSSPEDLYLRLKHATNPEHPRMWPWLYHTYKADAPYSFVRNPYYFVVDEAGNQLPYVDQMRWEAVQSGMISAGVASGRFTFSINKSTDLTLLIDGQSRGDYRVYRWMRADRSDAMIHVNLNRKVEEGKPETASKRELLRNKTFRQALSLAIDRQAIIDVNYFGETVPAQTAPGPESAFYNPRAFSAFTDFDPDTANRMLDEIGLTRRDAHGYRTDREGRRLTFFLNHAEWLNPATALFIAQDWGRVGIRTIPRMRSGRMFYTEKTGLTHDFTMFTGENELYPILQPRVFLPVGNESNFALAYAKWYERGGLYGNPAADAPGTEPVPEDHPLHEALTIYEQLKLTGDRDEQIALFKRITDIAADNTWTIGICTSPRYVVCVKNNFRNVPELGAYTFSFLAPANCGLETYFFTDAEHSPAVAASIKQQIIRITPAPNTVTAQARAAEAGGGVTASVIRWLFIGIGAAVLLLLALRHPFVARRLAIMLPTMAVISVIVFLIIELPPGDYIDARIAELQTQGDDVNMAEIEAIKRRYLLDEPLIVRYSHWVGLHWFFSYEQSDMGLMQGHLGFSMTNHDRPVNQVVGDRITLTFLISLGTILFTWALAIPIGIFSAARQYSFWDYTATLIGFVGMCVPSFLLALLLMFFSQEVLGIHIDRLFSEKYAMEPRWSVGKFLDLLKHIWAPVLILGIGGTAGMIRIMRGNLLDELQKPYVTTARAKGVRPMRLLLKYPVRLALNPFISGIGGIFPQLISGGTLVAVVLSLPTVGPLMLEALENEDTYLAGSMLMVLSLLGILGVLVSDLLLLILDPRIRFEGGSR